MGPKGNVAIDGPAGAGKSTAARMLAARIDYLYIDTGAMYRALTWKGLACGLNFENHSALTRLAEETGIYLSEDPAKNNLVYCDGQDITVDIRLPEVSWHVSAVAAVPGVRLRMADVQRKMAASDRVVMDGRDIGTYVLPDAPFKFFITASLRERARRRFQEMVLLCEGETTLETIMAEIQARDEADGRRAFAPLVQAQDALLIETDQMTPEEVVEHMLKNML